MVPRGHLSGPGIPLGVSDGVDSEKVRKSTVRVVYGEGSSKIVSSGFFVAPDKIATNIHVVAAADPESLRVQSGDTDYAIQGVTAFDAQNDLTILKVSGKGVPLVVGDSEAVRSGDTVFSVGYPVDRYNVMKNNVDSVLHNSTCFQMTSNIPSGSSGGPVLNTEGEVIGINVAGYGLSGYAIASNALKILLARSGTPEPSEQWQKRGPVHAYACLVQASQEFYAGSYAKAINVLNKSIELNPTYFWAGAAYAGRGYAKTLLGQTDLASGNVAAAQRYYQEAIEDFDKTISRNPEYIAAYAGRGYAKTLLGQTDLASGNVAAAQRYYQEAIEDFDKTISRNPESPIYTGRGVTKIALGLSKASQGHAEEAQRYYQEAIEDCNKTINLNSEDAYTYSVRGYVQICLGDIESDSGNTNTAQTLYKGAIIDSDSAIRLDSENPYHYHTRGVAESGSW